jgi:[histone H3]-lysine27 N-trimethyltransferase EZH2
MKSYISVQRNFRVEDQRYLKNVPYLGEDADYDTLFRDYEDTMKVKIADNCDEPTFVRLVETVADSEFSADNIELFKAISETIPAKMSAREMFNKYHGLRNIPSKCHPSIDSAEAESLPRQETMSAFIKHFCRRCLIYGCVTHKEPSKPITNPHLLFADKPKVEKDPCGEHCHKLTESNKNHEVEEETACALAADDVWTGSDQSFFRVLRFSYQKDFCGIARVMQTKTCKQVYEFSLEEEEEGSLSEYCPQQSKQVSKAQKAVVKKSHVEKPNNESFYYNPCECKGTCTENCPCSNNKNFCEKFCSCSSITCSNRFPGCKCKSYCINNQCSCFLALRECDPDVCCCNIKEKGKKTCKNTVMQRGEKKHLLLAPSDVAGWGIFSKIAIEKDELVSVSLTGITTSNGSLSITISGILR